MPPFDMEKATVFETVGELTSHLTAVDLRIFLIEYFKHLRRATMQLVRKSALQVLVGTQPCKRVQYFGRCRMNVENLHDDVVFERADDCPDVICGSRLLRLSHRLVTHNIFLHARDRASCTIAWKKSMCCRERSR
jgi:hypothetical protein